MNKLYLRYCFLLLIYVGVQVLILNQVLFNAYINPFLYILLIINLPLKTPKWFLLFFAFFSGLFIDMFSSSLGFHSSACVLIAFIKPLISKICIPHNTLGEMDEIILQKIGYKSYIVFSFILILVHNSFLFILEHLNINLQILIKIIMSSSITLIILLITQILIQKKK